MDHANNVPKKGKEHPAFPATHEPTAFNKIASRFERCQQVLDMIHADGDDPLLLLWRIAQTPNVDARLRLDAAKEVASYLHSKQTSVKVSGGDTPIKFTVAWDHPTDVLTAPVIVGQLADDAELITFDDGE